MQVFEISFECGNKVGGIHTVISTKASEMVRRFGHNYLCIGFYNESRAKEEVLPLEVPQELKNTFKELEGEGIICYYGKWIKGANARIILLNTKEFEKRKINDIKTEHWLKYKIDSLFAPYDYNEPVAWSYACGKLLEKIVKVPFVAHFHEWLSGAGLLYLTEKLPNAPTVFTTHATFLARVLGANIEEVRKLKKKNIDELARKLNITAKHQMEKLSAHYAKVVTTVSDITKEEVEIILGRKVDIVTYNALDFSAIRDPEEIIAEAEELRKELDKFLISYFSPYYPIEVKDKPIIFTSGRYEFWNKGFDLFIKGLGELNERLKGKTSVFAFILVPSDIGKPKEHILDSLLLFDKIEEVLSEGFSNIKERILNSLGKWKKIGKEDFINEELIANLNALHTSLKKRGLPSLSPFYLNYDENSDLILKYLREQGLTNKEEDAVKVIFYPRYLKTCDEVLGLSYREFLKVADIGVFLSRYEPFGYTPLETASYYVTCSITSNYGGFGSLLKKLGKDGNGVWVVNAVNKKEDAIVDELVDILEYFCTLPKEKMLSLKINARKSVEYFNWKNFIGNYIKAYTLALERSKMATKNL